MFSQTARRAAAQYAGAYRSPFAPKYHVPPHVQGLNVSTATKYATIASAFGVSAGVFALFFFGEVPRVRNDILRKVPYLEQYYDRSVPAEDNPF